MERVWEGVGGWAGETGVVRATQPHNLTTALPHYCTTALHNHSAKGYSQVVCGVLLVVV